MKKIVVVLLVFILGIVAMPAAAKTCYVTNIAGLTGHILTFDTNYLLTSNGETIEGEYYEGYSTVVYAETVFIEIGRNGQTVGYVEASGTKTEGCDEVLDSWHYDILDEVEDVQTPNDISKTECFDWDAIWYADGRIRLYFQGILHYVVLGGQMVQIDWTKPDLAMWYGDELLYNVSYTQSVAQEEASTTFYDHQSYEKFVFGLDNGGFPPVLKIGNGSIAMASYGQSSTELNEGNLLQVGSAQFNMDRQSVVSSNGYEYQLEYSPLANCN